MKFFAVFVFCLFTSTCATFLPFAEGFFSSVQTWLPFETQNTNSFTSYNPIGSANGPDDSGSQRVVQTVQETEITETETILVKENCKFHYYLFFFIFQLIK